MRKYLIIAAAVLIALLAISKVDATGGTIKANVLEPAISYRIGDTIVFVFGGIADDPEGADNICTFKATLPNGSIVNLEDVYIANGMEFLFYQNYVVRAEDVKYTDAGQAYVRATLSMIGYDTLGGEFSFFASASALIIEDEPELATLSAVKKVKKDNPHKRVK